MIIPNQRHAWSNFYNSFKWNGVSNIQWFSSYIKPEINVLELGCGNGKTLIELSKFNLNITAIDLSQKAIDISKNTVKNSKIKYVRLDVMDIESLNETYDLIIGNYFLHHFIDSSAEIVLKKLYSVLNKDGIIAMENFSINDVRFSKGKKLDDTVFLRNNILYNYFSKERLEKIILNSNFEIIENVERERISAKVVKHYLFRTIIKKN